MSILEILEAHTVKRPWSEASRMRCKCGETVTAETEGQLYALHRAHVAQVLEQHEREREAAALEEYASGLEIRLAGATRRYGQAVIEGHDIIRELRDRAERIRNQR